MHTKKITTFFLITHWITWDTKHKNGLTIQSQKLSISGQEKNLDYKYLNFFSVNKTNFSIQKSKHFKFVETIFFSVLEKIDLGSYKMVFICLLSIVFYYRWFAVFSENLMKQQQEQINNSEIMQHKQTDTHTNIINKRKWTNEL